MKILVDMNLSPQWVKYLTAHGFGAAHWSEIGDPRASDTTVLNWAARHHYVVFTNDLDFGAILAASFAEAPSVIQVRVHDVLPEHLGPSLTAALRTYKKHLEDGALVALDSSRARVRILPIGRR